MTRKQMALIIVVNALISTAISVIVVLLIFRLGPPSQVIPQATVSAAAGATVTQVPAGATPTTEVVLHVVQSGDTISGLSFQYNVPEADIIAANNLENPNFLQVGMELIIPVGGVPEVTATFTPAPTPTDTPIPFEPPSAEMTATAAAAAGATATDLPTPLPEGGEQAIQISEILAAGDAAEEHVVIVNSGEQLADMLDWTLSDADGNTFTFPNFRLWGGGSATLHTRVGQDGSPPANFYWGKLESIWSPGEIASLKDADGKVVSTYVVGP